MIEIENIPHLSNIELKYKQTKYPQCKDPNVPRLFFVSLFIGSKGSGKTYSACQLLKLYEQFGIYNKGQEVIQRIILISPTTQANPVFKSLKYLDEQDIFEDYSDDLLIDIVEDIKKEKENTEQYLKEMKAWKRFCKCKDVDELSHEDILLLHKNDFNEPLEPRFNKMVVNHIILDDLVGSSAYKSTGRSALNNILLKSRHLSINFFIMSQNLKAIPKTIRTNTSVFVVFKFGSKKIVCQDLYEEASNLVSLEDFEDLYEFATEDPHDSLIIDFTANRDNRFKKNWHQILRISNKKSPDKV
jgi:hypothetical protein